MNEALKVLYRAFPSCVRSGFCCKQAPCPFGEADSDTGHCIHLAGDRPGFYSCAIRDEIQGKPGADLVPAFGAGCCSTLNTDRDEARRNREAAHEV